MKKKILFCSLVLGTIGLGLVATLLPKNHFFAKVDGGNTVFTMDASNNNYETLTKNELTGYTRSKNPISFKASSEEAIADYEGGAFTLSASSTLESATAITGITSLRVDTANGETLKVGLGYGQEECEWIETITVADDDPFNFNNTQPSFLSFKNETEEPISIVSITINYNCTPQSYIWELKGSFNSWGAGIPMYYNYSNENISTQDQYFLKNVTFEKGETFKLHSSADKWLGVTYLENIDGTAKKAGQISGADDILVKTKITTDIYLKIERDSSKESIYIPADPNAVIEENSNAYKFTLTGSTTALGSWDYNKAPAFVLDTENSTETKLYYTLTIDLTSNTEFKIVCVESVQWIGDNWSRHETTSNIGKNGENFKVNVAGNYTIKLNGVSPKFGENGWDLSIQFIKN